MQMVRADQMEIFQNKRMTFGGTPVVNVVIGMEITDPLTQNVLFHFVVSLRRYVRFLMYQRDFKFGMTSEDFGKTESA